MANFSNFSDTFRYTLFSGITASSALTTNLRAELVTNGNWTEPTSGTFRSPVDSDGRFVEIVVTEPSAVRWQWEVLNDLGGTVCTREILLSGAGEDVRFYSGDYYVWVEIDKGVSNDEALGCGLLDLSPEAQDAHQNYTWGRGFRNSSGTSDGQGDVCTEFFLADNGTYGSVRRMMGYRNQQSTEIQLATFSGAANIHLPAELTAQNNLSQQRYAGRIFNMIRTITGADNEYTVPIGTAGETATFRTVGTNNDNTIRLGIRIA